MADNTIATESLGTFKTGEVPVDLAVRFDDHDGSQLNISTGFTSVAYWRHRSAAKTDATSLTTNISVAESALGLAVVAMTAAMTANTGSYFLEVWVGNAGNDPKLSSVTYSYYVEDSIAAAPTFPV